MKTLRGVFVFLLWIGLSGCGSAASTSAPATDMTQIAATAQPPVASPVPTLSPSPLPPTTAPVSPEPIQPSPVATLASADQALTPTAGELVQTDGTLTVRLSAEPDVTVSTAEYVLSGAAPAGAVVTVNDDILLVDSSQSFSTRVALEEGPNLVEIVASDETGQEVSFLITVTYLPDK